MLDARAPEESAASGPSAVPEASCGQGVIYEVFRQERKGQPFQHAGSVAAPDEQFAEIYAREQYGRRQESVALWLVARDDVSEIAEFPDEFDLKYRRVDGYSIKTRLREARERAGTLDMAPGASDAA